MALDSASVFSAPSTRRRIFRRVKSSPRGTRASFASTKYEELELSATTSASDKYLKAR